MKKTNAVVTVDRSLLKHNVSVLSEGIGAVDLMGVIKADAYGHGAIQVARTLEPILDAFAVNDIQEAAELRAAGIHKPILVFGVPEPSSVMAYREHEITATISAKEHFEMLSPGTSYQLNFNTGMNRLGFEPHQAEKVSWLVKNYSDLKCTGLYTHFATSGEPRSSKVAEQENLFSEIRKYFSRNIPAHVSNTGGAAFYNFNNHYDMVRLGIGLYGYSPGETEIKGLRPVLQWRSRLAAVKKIQKGESVSYGATWQAPANGILGVIPVGYEDGVKRSLSGQLSVQIDNISYEVVGNITMNYCMVYLGQDVYPTGKQVELLNTSHTAREWAQKTDTISYEILTGINRNIPRKYIG